MALGDNYTNRPWAPSQDVLAQQTDFAQKLPGLGQQMMQEQAQREEQARNKRPVTAWEKALMHMINGGYPKEAAGMVKSEMANQGGGAATQMPMPIGNRNAPLNTRAAFAQQNARNQDQTGLGAPQAMPSQDDSTFQGMTHRDFNDYIDAMKKIHSAKLDKSQTDLMALEQEKTRRALGVANIGATAKTSAATITGNARVEANKASVTQRADAMRESLKFKREHETNLKQYRNEYLDVLKNRQSTYDSYMKGKGSSDPVFNALVKAASDATKKASATAAASGDMAALPEHLKAMEEADKEQKLADERVLEYIQTHPELQRHGSETEASKSKQSGYKAPEPESAKTTVKMRFKNGRTAEVPLRDEEKAKQMGGVRVE